MLKVILSFTLFLISVFAAIIYGQNSESGPSSGNESNLVTKNEIATNGTLTITGTVLSEKNEIVREGIVNLFRSIVFENKSTLKLVFNDIFATNYIQAKLVYSNYDESFVVKRDSRVAILTYTYNFGNGKAVTRRKTGGADEEKARANSSNG